MDATGKLLTADELADRLQVRPNTVRLWAREGVIPAVRVGGKIIRFDFADVVGMLKQQPPQRRAAR